MPLKCPKCSRINADKAQRCVYCEASLENAQPFTPTEDISKLAEHFLKKGEPETKKPSGPPALQKQDSEKRQKVPLRLIPGGAAAARRRTILQQRMEPVERFWVIMAPTKPLSKELNKQLAEHLKMDPFVVRQRIASGNPWVLRRMESAEEAREQAVAIQRMGLDVFSLTDSEIRAVPERMTVQKVSLSDEGFTFERDKEKILMRFSDVALIVKGRIRTELANEAAGRRVASKLISMGLQPTASGRWECEVADLYPRVGRGARISERDTNFAGLGRYRSHSSLQNLQWIISQFKSRAAATIDDGYRKTTRVMKPYSAQRDSVARRLGQKTNHQAEMEYNDNSEHFDEYSSLAYLHFRTLGG